MRLVAALLWPTINDVTTGATPEYPALQAQRFGKPVAEVYAAALATTNDMGLVVVVQSFARSPDSAEIHAVATTRLWRFKDDVAITLRREGDLTTVNVRSHSRIGKGDLGANARRIRDFQARLAARL